MNPSTAFGQAFGDELARCGLREVVLAPGSRSTPLAMAFGDLEQRGRLRLHVRIDERSASFAALGLATMSLLSGDVTADPLVPEEGELPVRRPAVEQARLARFETDPAPWRARVAAAAKFLDEVPHP